MEAKRYAVTMIAAMDHDNPFADKRSIVENITLVLNTMGVMLESIMIEDIKDEEVKG